MKKLRELIKNLLKKDKNFDLQRQVIENPIVNWPLSALVWVINYLTILLLLFLVGWLCNVTLVNNAVRIIAFIIAAIITFKEVNKKTT